MCATGLKGSNTDNVRAPEGGVTGVSSFTNPKRLRDGNLVLANARVSAVTSRRLILLRSLNEIDFRKLAGGEAGRIREYQYSHKQVGHRVSDNGMPELPSPIDRSGIGHSGQAAGNPLAVQQP